MAQIKVLTNTSYYIVNQKIHYVFRATKVLHNALVISIKIYTLINV